MDQNLFLLAAFTATFFAAGIVKGVTGMGLPTVAMGVLGALLSPLAAASLLLAPSFVTNLWQLLAGPNFGAMIRRFWPMMLMVALGTVPGSALLIEGDTRVTTTALGAALTLYAAYALLARPFRVPERLERVASPVAGFVTGLVTGGTGVFVIPAVPYLQSLGLERDDLVQALGLSFTVSTIALGLALGWSGGIGSDGWLASALAVVPALAGMQVGQLVRTRISPLLFRRLFLVLLLLLGLDMAFRPLF
ncbi:sulfite exporter TauE/SafE family protein [Fulvimarina endophytica]|uniref:Probable membrane transporter protein n=1 Tax=Fulvimarina endophytica TaxID=2293836 RepID=A0A371X465_9HYPH|nr:sulfite exporter TauE/SafE family protein [Fulvimarina endophytica]RFC64032.1 sulfite exporter TauE/SafE family protein [Fulvimarina endophytica]